jgi:hypothetical protein
MFLFTKLKKNILRGDETWLNHYDPEIKEQS